MVEKADGSFSSVIGLRGVSFLYSSYNIRSGVSFEEVWVFLCLVATSSVCVFVCVISLIAPFILYKPKINKPCRRYLMVSPMSTVKHLYT